MDNEQPTQQPQPDNTPPASGPVPEQPTPSQQPATTQPQQPEPEVEVILPTESKKSARPLRIIASVIIISSGLISGLFLAIMLNFCLKNCPPPSFFEATAIIWGPAGSLLFTIPIVRAIMRR